MPLFRRLPKRGFSNARFKVDYATLNVQALKLFEPGSTVDLDSAKARGMIPKTSKRLKILAKGDLDRPLTIRAHRFSARAKDAITNAGGTAEEVA